MKNNFFIFLLQQHLYRVSKTIVIIFLALSKIRNFTAFESNFTFFYWFNSILLILLQTFTSYFANFGKKLSKWNVKIVLDFHKGCLTLHDVANSHKIIVSICVSDFVILWSKTLFTVLMVSKLYRGTDGSHFFSGFYIHFDYSWQHWQTADFARSSICLGIAIIWFGTSLWKAFWYMQFLSSVFQDSSSSENTVQQITRGQIYA